MFYRFVRAIVSFALRLFYRVHIPSQWSDLTGPVMYVGNHPNGLIDPVLVFVISKRPVTFLAKAPLFKMPVIGWILRGLQALPVYRKQDDPSEMYKNEGTLESAIQALQKGGAITLFPEGKSHSEPSLAELRTGAARIALRAAREHAPVQIVPVGLTYAQKHRFRSEVFIDVGDPIRVPAVANPEEGGAVRQLTAAIADGLKRVTLNLEAWEDLSLLQFAEALYAFRTGEKEGDPKRLRSFARGLELFRREEPERFQRIRAQLMSFREQLFLARTRTRELALEYRPPEVLAFAFRNLLALAIGIPLFALGILLFVVPFYVTRLLSRVIRVKLDTQATVKFLATLVIAPLWLALLTATAWKFLGPGGAILALFGSLPLAIFTRYFLEHWARVLGDVRTFLAVGNRKRLRERLLSRGEKLSREVEALAIELQPRAEFATAGASKNRP